MGSVEEGPRYEDERLNTYAGSLNLQLPELDQLDNRLRTTFDVQLLHYVRDVVADRFLADEKLLGNVAGRFVLHKQLENFAFPIGEKEFAFVIAAFQRVSPLLAREWNDYKVKGYSQLYLMKGRGHWCGNPVILGVQPSKGSFRREDRKPGTGAGSARCFAASGTHDTICG